MKYFKSPGKINLSPGNALGKKHCMVLKVLLVQGFLHPSCEACAKFGI